MPKRVKMKDVKIQGKIINRNTDCSNLEILSVKHHFDFFRLCKESQERFLEDLCDTENQYNGAFMSFNLKIGGKKYLMKAMLYQAEIIE